MTSVLELWIVRLQEDTEYGSQGELASLFEEQASPLIESGAATLWWNKTMPWPEGDE